MKKQITPQQKSWGEKRDLKIITIVFPLVLLIFGIWMLLKPEKPKSTARVQKVTTAFINEIWGTTAGIIFCVLGALLLIYTIKRLLNFLKHNPKPY